MGQKTGRKQQTAIDRDTERELLDILYKHAPVTLFSSMLIAVLILTALYRYDEARSSVFTWFFLLMAANLSRLIVNLVRDSPFVMDKYAGHWLLSYGFLSMIAGILWSMLVLIYRESLFLYEQVILLVTLIALPMASLPTNALKLQVYYAFSMPILISLQYWAFFVSQEMSIEFSILALAYSTIVLLTGHVYHRSFTQVLRIKYEKQDLVEELSKTNKRLQQFAYSDPLTGLTNRRWFSEQADMALERCQRRQHRLAIMLIDLDNFKEINDTQGHTTGDEFLIVIAKRLKSALRQYDTLSLTSSDTARYGGDEFILMLEDFNDILDVEKAAERILLEVNKPIVLEGHKFYPGCSIGVSTFPDQGDTVSSLIRQADIALYQAKQSGKGRAHFFTQQSLGDAENH